MSLLSPSALVSSLTCSVSAGADEALPSPCDSSETEPMGERHRGRLPGTALEEATAADRGAEPRCPQSTSRDSPVALRLHATAAKSSIRGFVAHIASER